MSERSVDKTEVINLVGDVDIDMFKSLIAQLGQASFETDRFVIRINTEGGDVYQALAIYDTINLISNAGIKVDIHATGAVMSAGMIILQAGTKRLATKNATFMIHYGEEMNNTSESAKHNRNIFKLLKKIMFKHCTVGARTTNTWFKTDTYFNTTEAINYGLIDGIVGGSDGRQS